MGKTEKETRLDWHYWYKEKLINRPETYASIIASIVFILTMTAVYGIVFGVFSLAFIIFTSKFISDNMFREQIKSKFAIFTALAIILNVTDTITTHYGLKLEGTYETNTFLVFLWQKFGYFSGFLIHETIQISLISIFLMMLLSKKNKYLSLIGLTMLSGMIIMGAWGTINNLYVISSLT